MLDKLKSFLKNNWILILILVVATFLRFYKLDVLPPGLYPDEAANGHDVISIIENHEFRAIYDTNGPREALFIYFQALFVWLGSFFKITALNFTALSLRIAPAIIGVLSVWSVYLFSKELFKNKEIGLISASAMAVSAWHIQFSRNGFRAIMLPLALSLLFYFFIKAYRDKQRRDYILFGAMLAFGFYTYLSIRMVPFIFIAFLAWTFFFDRKFLKENFNNILWAGGAFLVLLIPMLIHFVQVPADIFGRASTSIFNPDLNNGSSLLTLLNNIKKEILMFNFSGDLNFRHNLGGSPMLDIVTGIFFWVGFAVSLINIKKIEHYLLLAWLGAMSLPMILTAEGIPHALRLVGIMPVVFIWIAVGVYEVSKRLKNKTVKYAFLTIVLFTAGFLGFQKYFIDFPARAEARDAYTEDMVYMANDLNDAPDGRVNYLVTGEFGLKTVQFLTHPKNPTMVQLETYEIRNQFRPKGLYYKVFVTPQWLEQVRDELTLLGYDFEFTPVYSKVDGRTLYYVYTNN
jgi:4-amino-4-deoxy-L-arabinose transferase-like glycosyltransferase